MMDVLVLLCLGDGCCAVTVSECLTFECKNVNLTDECVGVSDNVWCTCV